MTMPILPGLAGTAVPAGSLTDVLDALAPDQIAELVAEAAGSSDPDADPVEGGEDDTDGEAEEEGELSDEEVEARATELGDAGELEAITTWSERAIESLNAAREQLAEMHTTAEAEAERGADPDAIEALLDRADELVEQAVEADDEAAAAAKSEDAKACAEAALRVHRFARAMRALIQEAQPYTETTTTDEATAADEPAVKLWAERTKLDAGF